MKNVKRKGKKTFDRLNHLLEIPKEISTDLPKITILGFDEILVENYKNILEYQDIFIRINTFQGIINISGFNLKLDQMTNEDIKVIGKIDSIDLESITD